MGYTFQEPQWMPETAKCTEPYIYSWPLNSEIWGTNPCSWPGSSVHAILQARILEWVAISSSRGSSWPRDRTRVSCISFIGRWILYCWAIGENPLPSTTAVYIYWNKQTYMYRWMRAIHMYVIQGPTILYFFLYIHTFIF